MMTLLPETERGISRVMRGVFAWRSMTSLGGVRPSKAAGGLGLEVLDLLEAFVIRLARVQKKTARTFLLVPGGQ